MTWEEMLFRPIDADPFMYRGAAERQWEREQSGSRELRPDIGPLRPTDRGSTDYDPTTGGKGQSGERDPCWINAGDNRCYKTLTARRRVRTVYKPIGNRKLGIQANYLLELPCGTGGTLTLGGEVEEASDDAWVAYLTKLRNFGFSEVMVPLEKWSCGKEPFDAKVFLKPFYAALEAGYRPSEIQVSIPGQICDCFADGTLTDDQMRDIWQEVEKVQKKYGESILGFFFDEISNDSMVSEVTGKDTNKPCRDRLWLFRSLSLEYNVPFINSGYNLVLGESKLSDLVDEYSTGGVAYSGYDGDTFTTEHPFGWWKSFYEKYRPFQQLAEANGRSFIIYPFANLSKSYYDDYLENAKIFGRIYAYSGDMKEQTKNDFFQKDCYCDRNPYPSDYQPSHDNVELIRNSDICVSRCKCRDCIDLDFWKKCDFMEPSENEKCMDIRKEFYQYLCDRYWNEIEKYVAAAVRKEWVYPVDEYETVKVGTKYCKYSDCSKCSKTRERDWIEVPLPPCYSHRVPHLEENEGWSGTFTE